MSRDLTRPMQRGLLVHDPRVTLDREDVTHSWVEVGPRPGVPEDQGDPRSLLVVKASGHQSRDNHLQLRTIRSGFPGVRSRAGAYVYRAAADDDWRGWDVPNVITAWEWMLWAETPTTFALQQAHLLRLHDGRVLLAARISGLTLPSIRIRRYDPDTGTWTTLDDVAPPGDAALGTYEEQLHTEAWPNMVQLPGGRVLLFAWVTDGAGTYTQLSMWYSDDDGETWTRGERWCLAQALATTGGILAGKTRVAFNNGQLLLVATLSDGADPRLTQWASDDLGARFHHIVTFTALESEGPEILPRSGGGYLVMWLDPVVDTPMHAHIGSAWHAISETGATTLTHPLVLQNAVAELCSWTGEDGVWYIAMREDEHDIGGGVMRAGRVHVQRSIDEGASWPVADQMGHVWTDYGGALTVYQLAAVETTGRTLMAARVTTEVAPIDDASMVCLYLGGHTTVTLPSDTHGRREADQTTWDAAWIGMDPFDAWTNWTVASSGSTSADITADGLVVTATSSGEQTYTYSALTTGDAYENVVMFDVEIGHLTLGARAAVATWAGDGTAAYAAEARITSQGISLFDPEGLAQIGSAVSLTTAGLRLQVLFAVGSGRARLWYREVAAAGEAERPWVAGPVGNTSVVSSSPDVGELRVRLTAGPIGSSEVIWRTVCGVGLAPAVGLAGGPTYPDELFPRAFASWPVRLPGGVQVEATDGPTLDGDTWHIDPRFEFGLERLDPLRYPSPRAVARCEPGHKAELVYSLSGVSGEGSLLDTSTWGVGVYGANVGEVTLYGWDPTRNGGSGDWVQLTSGSSFIGGLAYQRVGDAVRPDPSEVDPATDPLYVERDMLRGAVIDLGSGKVRRIRTNTEGWWGTGPSRPPVLYLDPDYLDGTEPESGTCAIGPGERGQVLVVHGLAAYEKLRILCQTGWGSPVQVGTIVVGPVLLWGQEYSYGRVQQTTPNVTLTTARGGARHARREGPARRSVEFGWSEGVLERDLWTGTAPDYVCGQMGGDPVAVARDVGSMLAGLIEQVDGPRVPVVYLPAVSSEAAEVRLLWPSQHLYGRIVSDIRRETVIGDERRDELVRVASILIEEEV